MRSWPLCFSIPKLRPRTAGKLSVDSLSTATCDKTLHLEFGFLGAFGGHGCFYTWTLFWYTPKFLFRTLKIQSYLEDLQSVHKRP